MQPDKTKKLKSLSNDTASERSVVAKGVASGPLPRKVKKAKGKSGIDSRTVEKTETEHSSKRKTKVGLEGKHWKESQGSGVPCDFAEMEVSSGEKCESRDAPVKSCSKKEKLATRSKQSNDNQAFPLNQNSGYENCVSPDYDIKTEKGDVLKANGSDNDHAVPMDEKKEDESDEAVEKTESDSELTLETTENNSSQEEMEVKEKGSSDDDDDEEEMSDEESDAKEDDEDEKSSDGDSEDLVVEDLVDDEAEEGSETDESPTQSEITLSSSDEERKEAMFAGGSKMASSFSTKKSNREYDEESDDMDGFIVDDDVVEPMSSDEADDLPDVLEEEISTPNKRRRILTLPDSSDSDEDSQVDIHSEPPCGKKTSKSKQKSQPSVEDPDAEEEPELATERNQMYDQTREVSSAKSKLKRGGASQASLLSEQKASVSKGRQKSKALDNRAQQISKGSRATKAPQVQKSLGSPRAFTPIKSRLSRLDEFRISKGLSPTPHRRRESRDGSENWFVSDVYDSSMESSDNLPQPKKKYAKLVTIAKRGDCVDAYKRVLKRSRCESESPLPRKKFKR